MAIFDTNSITNTIVDKISKSIDDLGAKQANAIIEGFERAAHIIADRLEKIEKEREEK